MTFLFQHRMHIAGTLHEPGKAHIEPTFIDCHYTANLPRIKLCDEFQS